MPSIPQSLLWISLVVLWLFVLVPMLISKRDAVRRTSDVALATRVLNGGRNARLLKRPGPAAGHASDPDWRPSDDESDDFDEEPAAAAEAESAELTLQFDESATEEITEEFEAEETAEEELAPEEPAAEESAAEEPAAEEPAADAPAAAEEPAADEPAAEDQDDYDVDDGYEYVDDSSGLEAPSETDLQLADSLTAARQRRRESTTAAAVSVRKYQFRRRMLTVMGVMLVASAAAAFTVAPAAWWACGGIGAVTLIYLSYLRRQTRIEERLRRRRAQRVARSRLGVENTDDRDFDVVPSRLRRPGSVVLEIDDEDPVFEHLDYALYARHFDLPRAAGQ